MEELYGALAIAFGAAGYIWTHPRMVLRFAACATATWIAYFFALGQIGAALSTSVGLASILCGVWISDRYLWPMITISSAIAVSLLLMSTGGLALVLLSTGYVLKTVALGFRERPIAFRGWVVSGELSYLTFGIVAGAYSTIAWSCIVAGVALASGVVIAMRRSTAPPLPESDPEFPPARVL